ncbi:MAG TPA: alkaline phosphatase family protein [Vicinamibacterales bacterium]|jgi:phospholipase C
MKRRDFLRGLAGVSGAALLGGAGRASAASRPAVLLPDPSTSGIEHIVVVIMENRSFDHLLGWLPSSDGRQAGLRYDDLLGLPHGTHPLPPDYTGAGHADPDHSYIGGRIQYNRGAMDRFLRLRLDGYPAGYYREADRPFFSALARHYTVLDRSFCSILGPTFPNRLFLHAAQTDRLDDSLSLTTLPTIWDRLAAAGVSHAYYFSNLPFVALWGLQYLPISRFYSQFLTDAALGQLPAVSFVDPSFTIADNGSGNDDHPHADIRKGDAFLAETFLALASGPASASTAFIVTYDEWGGFFDHVPPPRAAAANLVDPDLVDGKARLGFRVPTIVASPWTRATGDGPRVNSGISDHTSILKLIEWRWELAPLTPRDGSNDVQNLAEVFDWNRPPATDVPALPIPAAPPATAPAATASATARPRSTEWQRLLDSGLLARWPLERVR